MLILLVIVSTCQVTQALSAGFLDECPIDREQRIGGTLVIDILETFYKDLIFVQACTESQQLRDYGPLFQEMKDLSTKLLDRENFWSLYSYTLVIHLLQYLMEDQLDKADELIYHNKGKIYIRDWVATYFEYIDAEAKRLIGEYDEASTELLSSFLKRQKYRGVSMNQLERLDGLLVLRKLFQFNRAVDRLYGLSGGPNHQLLSLIHFISKGELAPLNEIRNAIVDRFPFTVSAAGSSKSNDSIHIELGTDLWEDENFIGQSVGKAFVESTLCEFAQKFNIIGPMETSTPDYSGVIDQVKRIDAKLAQQLDENIVKYVDEDIERSKESVKRMWAGHLSSAYGQAKIEGIFLAYFHIELNFLQSEDGCNIWKLDSLRTAYDLLIHKARSEHEGLSLDKVAELGAKIELHYLSCFHERLKLAYELDGTEDDQQLAAKRSRLGDSCERTLPDSNLLRPISFYE